MTKDILSFDEISRIFGKMYKISSKSDEKLNMLVLNDFYYDPLIVPQDKLLTWSKAVDFESPLSLPCGEVVTGFRFIDFKDCTNAYYVNTKDEGRSFDALPDVDQRVMLGYMAKFADKQMQRLRRNRSAKAYSVYRNGSKAFVRKDKSVNKI